MPEPIRQSIPPYGPAHPERMTPEQRWLGFSPEEMARATLESWGERCPMAFQDIATMPGSGPIIAEGPGFFPAQLAHVLSDNRKAIWLIPTEEFKRRSALARGKPGSRHATSDPEQATANIIARDLLMGRVIREQCEALGMAFVIVAGEESVDALANRAAARFEEWL